MNPVNLTFSHRYLSTMILVNFVMQILEIFISLSILGATYARQIISISQPNFTGVVDLDRQKLSNIRSGILFAENLNNFYTTSSVGFPLTDFLNRNFGPRYMNCLSDELELFPLNNACLNSYELAFISISGATMLLALICSYYFLAISVKSFRQICRSFKDLYDDNDSWVESRFPRGWTFQNTVRKS